MLCPNCQKAELVKHPENKRVVGCPQCFSTFRSSILEEPQERETKPQIPVAPMKKVIKFMDGEQ